ncbi:MAG: site-specific integrase, partial [Planctomycetes bacterium]|nr:site-specific integrase [Planctomycetota bacterium]
MAITVRQKRKGKGQPWHVFVHSNGAIRSRAVGAKRDAEAVASKLRRKMALGEFNANTVDAKPKSPMFVEYAQGYLDNYVATTLKRTTAYGYRTIVDKHLIPAWKGLRLDQITRAEVKRLLLQKQRDGFAPGTVENIKALVSGIFTHALEDEVLAANPALRLGRFIKKQDHRKNINPLSREQSVVFLQAVRTEFPEWYPFMLTAFRTGLRQGELIGLAWEDLDFEACAIEVRRSFTHFHWSTPKSNKSRIVDMSDQLRAELLEHREVQRVRFGGQLPVTRLPDGKLIELVFTDRKGGTICADNFRKRTFAKMIEAADIPKFRFHDIRHTYASILLQNGESIYYVQKQMGHASITTTVDCYGHLVP